MKKWVVAIVFAVSFIGFMFWWANKSDIPSPKLSEMSNVYFGHTVDRLIGSAWVRDRKSGAISELNVGDQIPFESEILVSRNSYLFLVHDVSRDKLELGPNSQLGYSLKLSGKLDLVLEYYSGDILLNVLGEKSGPQTVVMAGQEKIQSASGDFSISGFDNNFQLNVTRGEVLVLSDSKEIRLKRDQTWIRANKKTKVENAKFALVTPLPNEKFFFNKNVLLPTRLAWQPIANAKYSLYFGPSAEELQLRPLPEVNNGENDISIEFGLGVHYWRIRTQLGGQVFDGPIYKFFVFEEASVNLESPEFQSQIPIDIVKNGVVFRWSNPSRLERLLLEVATNEEFDNPIVRLPLPNRRIFITPLAIDKGGKYFWRINGFRPNSSELITSQKSEFEVVESKLEVPQLSPKQSEVISERRVKKGLVFLKWRVPEGAGPVQLELRNRNDEVVLKQNVDSESFQLPPLGSGEYKWKVATRWGESDWSVFNIQKIGLLKWQESVEADIRDQKIWISSTDIKWDRDVRAKAYELSLEKIQSQKYVQKKDILLNQNKFLLSELDPGLYNLRVSALNADKKLISETEDVIVHVR